jgi:hypothetical protein
MPCRAVPLKRNGPRKRVLEIKNGNVFCVCARACVRVNTYRLVRKLNAFRNTKFVVTLPQQPINGVAHVQKIATVRF